MTKRLSLLAIAAMLGFVLLAAVYCTVGPEAFTVVPEEDWFTDNEDPCCPGDWDGVYLHQAGSGAYVTRTNDFVYAGGYAYEHYSACSTGTCWSYAYITCTVPMTQGVWDGWFLAEGDADWPPGHAGYDYHGFAAIGEITGYGPPLAYVSGWAISYDNWEDRSILLCSNCVGSPEWGMGRIFTDTWHHYRVEWNLPYSSTNGTLKAWMDDHLYVDVAGLQTQTGGSYATMDTGGAGQLSWHKWLGSATIHFDDVNIYPCDEPWPTPVPTPVPGVGDCQQYGHAAVLNVSDDECLAVLRFRTLPSYIPSGATVTRATLRIYGIAAEVPGETIYVTPLNALWGEMTTDWCRRLVGTNWAEVGAYDVPLDREPGTIANFQAALGWIDIELPVVLIEEWALTGEANPGLVFHNAELTGKFSFASREWYVKEDEPWIQPRINVWYTTD